MTAPKVSICVPNLNNRPYLPERFETIFGQTLSDWELIVYDSHSDDGAWEYIQALAAREPRMRISQGPREGVYPAWNACLRQARGDYVYFATSDDTMEPNCLAEMVRALEQHPDCGLCQCQLVIIDEKGTPLPAERQWDQYTLGSYSRELVHKKNLRPAPHDGLVHPALFTIYTSITQLLIRRQVFDRAGYFDGSWGAISDFEWDMRASLLENCVYIPAKLATWRVHPGQATQNVHTSAVRLKMIEMARAAFARARNCPANRLQNIEIEDFLYFLERDVVALGYNSAEGYAQKLKFLAGQLFQRPGRVWDHITDRFQTSRWGIGQSPLRQDRLRRMLEKHHVPPPIIQTQ